MEGSLPTALKGFTVLLNIVAKEWSIMSARQTQPFVTRYVNVNHLQITNIPWSQTKSLESCTTMEIDLLVEYECQGVDIP